MFPIGITSFSEMFSTGGILAYVIISVASGIVVFFSSIKFLLALQQGGYHGMRYFKWLGNRETPYRSRLMLLCLLGFLFFLVLNVCFVPVWEAFFAQLGNIIASYMGFVSYFLFTGVYINTESSVNAKVPLKKTKRLVRLCITFALMLIIFSFGLMVLVDYVAFVIGDVMVAVLRYSLICIIPILAPYILFLAYCLNEPLEWFIRTRGVQNGKAKLDRSNVLKIGITGSYGKTSVKEILRTILSQKYRVLASPESYNTPLGIAITVKSLDSTHDIFIAEMGARTVGDIAELAKMVKPKYAVLTGTNQQHLETFLSEENIKKTKYEIFENLDADGIGFFSADNEGALELGAKFGGEKYFSGLNDTNSTVTATNIKTGRNGTQFTLNIKGEAPVQCTTVLLGSHSISNICLAASVAYKVGMSPEEIAFGINRIQSVGHRLELLPNQKGVVIIDDSYNSNPDGTKAAMEVLDMFEGRKIVLTPGLVELGKIENVANLEFGKLLAKHVDKVIITGKHNAEMLINGLIDGGMDRSNIIYAKTLKKGNQELNEIIKEGDVVLFENDLPDNYN